MADHNYPRSIELPTFKLLLRVGVQDAACLTGRLHVLCFSHSSFVRRTSTVSTKPTSMILCPLIT